MQISAKRYLFENCCLSYFYFANSDTHPNLPQMNKIPSIPTLVGHNVVSDFEGGSEVVLRVSLGQSLHTVIIEEIVKLAIEDLGGSEDLVRKVLMYLSSSIVSFHVIHCLNCTLKVTKKDDIYLMIDKKGALMGCIVCEQVSNLSFRSLYLLQVL